MQAPDAAEARAPCGDVPDWQKRAEEIHCPMCEYNLRGLAEARCPECGYRFEWKDLLDAKLRPHPYLFEHHPEANVKSFWKTAWGGLRPWRFWRELHPAMPSRPGRLRLYRWLVALVGLWALIGLAAVAAAALTIGARQALQGGSPRPPPTSANG